MVDGVNMGLMAYVAKKAQELQGALPEIADDWVKDDIPLEKISRQRDLVGFLNLRGSNPEDIAASVVRAALYGFDDMGKIAGFPGLVARDVYDKVAKRHKREALEKYNNEGKTSLKNMSAEALRELSDKALIAAGKIPVSDKEKEFAYNRSVNPNYMTSRGVDWARISGELNDRFGNNRNRSSVRGIVYRRKEKLN